MRHPYVLHWQQIKTLFSTVQNLIVNEPGSTTEGVSSGAGTAIITQNPPPFFCSTVVRLISLQLISPIQYYSLEHICGGSAEFPSQEKAEGFLMHLLMPLCLKVCSGRGVSDVGMLKQSDVSFLVAATLNAMSPPAGRTGQVGNSNNRTGGDLRAGSLTFTGSRDAKRPARISGSLYQAAFLCKFSFPAPKMFERKQSIYFHLIFILQHYEFYAFVLSNVWAKNGHALFVLCVIWDDATKPLRNCGVF